MRDQPRVDRIRLAWIDHALAFRCRFHPHDPHEETVFQVPEEVVQRVLGDRDTLRLQRRVEFLDAEHPTGVAEQMTHEPAQRRHVAHVVALDHVAQHGHVDVVAQKLIRLKAIRPMALNPIAYTEHVVRSVLRYQLTTRVEPIAALRVE